MAELVRTYTYKNDRIEVQKLGIMISFNYRRLCLHTAPIWCIINTHVHEKITILKYLNTTKHFVMQVLQLSSRM